MERTEQTTTKETNENQSQSQKAQPAIAPGQLRVIKRNGAVVSFDAEKIAIAMTKAFLAVEGGAAAASTRIHDKVNQYANSITDTFQRRMPSGGTLHIEEIQDQVELELMRSGERKVARTYVLYREERRNARTDEIQETQNSQEIKNNLKKR